jgi:hypothetical protein
MCRAALTAAGAAVFLSAASLPGQAVRHDIQFGPEFLVFQDETANDASVAARVNGSLLWTPRLGRRTVLALEPRAGFRVLSFTDLASEELVAELPATIFGSAAGRRLNWQLDVRGKLRAVSDPPSLPAFIEPGRYETWAGGLVSYLLAGGWVLEARASAGIVRYSTPRWRVLDREALVGALGLIHPFGPGVARLSLGVGAEDYAERPGSVRNDGRWGIRFEWSTSETIFAQVEAGLAFNNSSLDGFDYRSGRFALLVSAPLGSGSAQIYGALAMKSYTNPGPPGARIAPSDRDTGSFLIAQFTHPLGETTNLHLRAEWSRSETGFRDQYFQRLGFSTLFSFRPRPPTGS